ncbi:MAG: hypothetical protein VKJ24_14935 [Synechococcales bacterium]|nr:hypothetical protein [Synechococcales bacterium]
MLTGQFHSGWTSPQEHTLDFSNRLFKQHTDVCFKHLLSLRQSPVSDTLDRLSALWIEGVEYPDARILQSLHQLAGSPLADQEFANFLNRCCYILVNYWWSHPGLEQTTADLIQLFQQQPQRVATSAQVVKLRYLVQQFTHTDYFAALCDRARVAQDSQPESNRQQPIIRELLPYYPYLYPYLLLGHDTSDCGHQAVRRLQIQRETEYDQKLSQYIPQLRANAQPRPGAIANPTHLSESEVKAAIKQYVGKGEDVRTYQENANRFLMEFEELRFQEDAKALLHRYLTQTMRHSVPSTLGDRFSHWLGEQLNDITPQKDHFKPTLLLLAETCHQLIETIVGNPRQNLANHYRFLDLHQNLGATLTIGLLLRIALLCRTTPQGWDSIKARIARCFAQLLQHYGQNCQSEHQWLVECLENLMIGLTLHTEASQSGRSAVAFANLL